MSPAAARTAPPDPPGLLPKSLRRTLSQLQVDFLFILTFLRSLFRHFCLNNPLPWCDSSADALCVWGALPPAFGGHPGAVGDGVTRTSWPRGERGLS